MATTPNYGWVTPAPTDFVTDLPADFETFADAVDADLAGLLGGTTGQVLTKDSNSDHDFSWTTIASGGETLITSGTLSGATVSVTSIPNAYKDLKIVIRNYLPSNDDVACRFRFNQDSTANRHANLLDTEGTFSFNTDSGVIVGNADNSVTQGLTVAYILDYANTTTWKFLTTRSLANNAATSTNGFYYLRMVAYNQTTAVSSFDLFPTSGNFTSGNYYVYGVS